MLTFLRLSVNYELLKKEQNKGKISYGHEFENKLSGPEISIKIWIFRIVEVRI